MSQEVADRVRSASIPTIVINTTIRLAPWADMLYAADQGWWLRHGKDTAGFEGLRVSSTPTSSRMGVHVLINTGKVGFDSDPHCVRTGGNSGHAAIHVAVHAGAKRILLCGYDMRGGHWHSRHPDPLRNASDGIYPRWIRHFGALAPELSVRGVEVLNCTPGSALTVWPYVDLEEALSNV